MNITHSGNISKTKWQINFFSFAISCGAGPPDVCVCKPNYIGDDCGMCGPGYYGEPRNISNLFVINNFIISIPNILLAWKMNLDNIYTFLTGDFCKPCECNGNINATVTGACNDITGICQECLYNTYGDHCERCEDWYYGDAIQEKNCRGKNYSS